MVDQIEVGDSVIYTGRIFYDLTKQIGVVLELNYDGNSDLCDVRFGSEDVVMFVYNLKKSVSSRLTEGVKREKNV